MLANELAGWTQRMTDALEKLHEAQEPKPKSDAAADAPDASKGPVADPVAAKQATAANAAAAGAGEISAAAIEELNSDNGEVAHNAAGTQDAESEVAQAASADAAAGTVPASTAAVSIEKPAGTPA